MSRFFLRCIDRGCGAVFDSAEKLYQCPRCRDLLELAFEYRLPDPAQLRDLWRQRKASRDPLDVSGVWRFREVLPVASGDWGRAVTMGEGNSPVLEAPHSARYAGLERLRVKHLGWNPTGSFKDYGMTVAATQARLLGSRWVACASTGNTSASMAAYAGRAGLESVVFIPEGQIAYGKLSQTLDYGALTLQVEGDFDAAMRLVRELSADTDLYLMNSLNPFRIEGQKTVLFELLDQLEWRVPDRIVLPGGNLGNSAAFGKALLELAELGLIEKPPRLTVVQAAGAAPLYAMLRGGSSRLEPVAHAETRASAIKIGDPVSWKKALRALQFSGGDCQAVSEEEIAEAKAVLGRDGIGCEPASATTVAGLRRMARGEGTAALEAGEEVVAILTGHQLKDSEYTVDYHLGRLEGIEASGWSNPPRRVPADKARILELLERLG